MAFLSEDFRFLIEVLSKPAENFKCSLLATKESSEASAEKTPFLCRGAANTAETKFAKC
ncbi:MAG: hypothetical protein MJY52_02270 [Bacteroidaceae bacterium]|nr:hypothetical protein [Bacteroidaceae bacterium]